MVILSILRFQIFMLDKEFDMEIKKMKKKRKEKKRKKEGKKKKKKKSKFWTKVEDLPVRHIIDEMCDLAKLNCFQRVHGRWNARLAA